MSTVAQKKTRFVLLLARDTGCCMGVPAVGVWERFEFFVWLVASRFPPVLVIFIA